MTRTITIQMPNTYIDDALSRDLDIGTKVKCNKRLTTLEVTKEQLEELHSDANYYSTEWRYMGTEFRGLGMSAKAAMKRAQEALEAWPDDDPDPEDPNGKPTEEAAMTEQNQNVNDQIEDLLKKQAGLEKEMTMVDDAMNLESVAAYQADCGPNPRLMKEGKARLENLQDERALVLAQANNLAGQVIRSIIEDSEQQTGVRVSFGYIGNVTPSRDDRAWFIQSMNGARFQHTLFEDGPLSIWPHREALATWLAAEAETWKQANGDSPTIITDDQAREALEAHFAAKPYLVHGQQFYDDSDRNHAVQALQAAFPHASYRDLWRLALNLAPQVIDQVKAQLKAQLVTQEDHEADQPGDVPDDAWDDQETAPEDLERPQLDELPKGDDIPAPQPTEADLDHYRKELENVTAARDNLAELVEEGEKKEVALKAELAGVRAMYLDAQETETRLAADIDEAAAKALDSLARYKFQMFGYWAGIWVHLNRIEGKKRPSPFGDLVKLARQMEKENGGKQ